MLLVCCVMQELLFGELDGDMPRSQSQRGERAMGLGGDSLVYRVWMIVGNFKKLTPVYQSLTESYLQFALVFHAPFTHFPPEVLFLATPI